MSPIKIIFEFFLVVWFFSFGSSMVLSARYPSDASVAMKDNRYFTKDDKLEMDCTQFKNDHEILKQLPFGIQYSYIDLPESETTAFMASNNQSVEKLFLRSEKFVPPSVFCLSNLKTLHIEMTPFVNGIVPDALKKLSKLKQLWIYHSPIVKMTEALGMHTELSMLHLRNCSLKSLPSLNLLQNLWVLDLSDNQLSKVEGIPGVSFLNLRNNLFNEIPTIVKKENILWLDVSNNLLKNIQPITSFINLEGVFLQNVTLREIPTAIGKLSKLQMLDLSGNKLSSLPKDVLNLSELENINIANNLFSQQTIKNIKQQFAQSRPNTELFI